MYSITCNEFSSEGCNFEVEGGHTEKVKKQMVEHFKENHLEIIEKANQKKYIQNIQRKIDTKLMSRKKLT